MNSTQPAQEQDAELQRTLGAIATAGHRLHRSHRSQRLWTGQNGFLPHWLVQVNDRFRVPTRALLLNFVVGLAFLLPLPSWQKIVAITGTLAGFTFAVGSVSVFAFRRLGVGGPRTRLPGMRLVAPAELVI